MLKQRKYEDMYFRSGLLDERITGMEWMEEGYDFRTFNESTPTALEFVKNLLDVLLVDTPNIEWLSYIWGKFIEKKGGFCSNELIKDYLQEVEIYPFVPPSKYKTEVSEIKVNFADKKLLFDEFKKVLISFSFKKYEGDNSFIFHGIKPEVTTFEADLLVDFQVENDYVTKLNFHYKRL